MTTADIYQKNQVQELPCALCKTPQPTMRVPLCICVFANTKTPAHVLYTDSGGVRQVLRENMRFFFKYLEKIRMNLQMSVELANNNLWSADLRKQNLRCLQKLRSCQQWAPPHSNLLLPQDLHPVLCSWLGFRRRASCSQWPTGRKGWSEVPRPGV